MSVVLLADVKRFGNFQAATQDTDIQTTIDAAEAIVARWIGPLTPTAVTERFYDVSTYISLHSFPVISVTSMTGTDGVPVDLSLYDVDLTSGTIYPDTVGYLIRFPLTRYTVVYQAGWSSVPGNVKQAIMELTLNLWRPRRGGGSRPGTGSDNQPDPPNYLLPNRVRSLLDPYIPLGIG
jgi:hypothetical protein